MTDILNPSFLDRIKGFMDPEEGRRLYEVALAAAEKGPVLEIGSYCGKSTVYIGAACREKHAVLFAVDHHRGSEEQQPGQMFFDPDLFDETIGEIETFRPFRDTLRKADLEDTVIPVVSKSSVVARSWATPLSMVFIDGGHTFEAAFTDYTCWMPHIVPGGFLVVHDIFEKPEEGGQAPWHVYETAKKSGLFQELPRTKTLGVLRRLESGELPDPLPTP